MTPLRAGRLIPLAGAALGLLLLHPIDHSTYQTWPAWYATPKCTAITSATRPSVHRSVL